MRKTVVVASLFATGLAVVVACTQSTVTSPQTVVAEAPRPYRPLP